jgi:hypothetical protein
MTAVILKAPFPRFIECAINGLFTGGNFSRFTYAEAYKQLNPSCSTELEISAASPLHFSAMPYDVFSHQTG